MLKAITDFLLVLKKKSPGFRGFFIFEKYGFLVLTRTSEHPFYKSITRIWFRLYFN